MKLLVIGILSLCATGCASYFQPPKPASEMWRPTKQAKVEVKTALEQCSFIDRLSAGPQKIQEQAMCMRNIGFNPDFSSYNAHNCYGDAPAACIVYWRQGVAKPVPVKPQPAAASN